MRAPSILLHFPMILGTVFSLSQDHDVSVLVPAINKLVIDLHRKIGPKEDGNVVTCPLTISTVLGMVYYGSRCKTEGERKRAFGYQNASIDDSEIHSIFKTLIGTTNGNSEANEYLLHIDNAVFFPKGSSISLECKNGLIENYGATVRNVDFQKEGSKATDEINDWVKRATNNQTENLLRYIDPSSSMVLLNVVHFKGTWKTPFDPKDTTENVFYNKGLQSEKATVLMMHLVAEVVLIRLGGARVIAFPYEHEDIVIVIVLSDTIDGAYEFENLLTPTTVKNMMEDVEKVEVRLSLPKLKLALETNLNTGFRELGIKNAFKDNTSLRSTTFIEFNEEGTEASLIGVSRVMPDEAIKINDESTEASLAGIFQVVQEEAIKINKNRSAAPEVTGVVAVTALKDGDNEFIANQPFLFAMLDVRTDVVLFQFRLSEL